MSRLYGSLSSDSSRCTANKRGHRLVTSHTRGWSIGIRVVARAIKDEDVFEIYQTGGSGADKADKLIRTIRGKTPTKGKK